MLEQFYDSLPSLLVKLAVYVLGALVLWLLGYVVHPFAFFQNPNRQLFGKWKRYGVGFHKDSGGNLPIHDADLLIVVLPLIAFAYSSNPTYSYFGMIRFSNDNMYISWVGLGHSEYMMSVFKKPLTVSSKTYLIGTKSCINRDGFPAMNKELLSKSEKSHEEIRSLVGALGDSIVINYPVYAPASYEVSASDS